MTNRIVIVGAGAAGIAAGYRLHQLGIHALIVEARARVGGRAYTDSATLDTPVDMGCGWLHCADTNPWTAYARTHGFDVIERSPIWRSRVGMRVPTAEEQAAWMAAWERNGALIAASAQSGIDVAVSDVVPQDEFRPTWDAVMTWLMGTESEHVSCVDFDRYVDSNHNWPVREGLGNVVAHAATGLNIQLQTAVLAIDWSGPRVALQTTRGTIDCDSVIVTVPTTVLANEVIRFHPSLPTSYGEAFAGIPLGVANKVFFTLEDGALPFEDTTHFVGSELSARTCSYAVRPSGAEVLLAFFGGALAQDLEARGELDMFARDELKSIFGADFIRRIRRSVHSAWSTDRFSAGSYSIALPGKAHLRAQLSEPVGGKIFFAGEANSIEHFGTINGAWESAAAAVESVLAGG